MSALKPLRPDYPELTVRTRAAWRRWLQKHHRSSRGVWFVHFRKGSGEKEVGYDELVEEALCFGWIDSAVRKLDELRYAHPLAYAIARVGDSDRRGSAVRAPIRIFRP